VKKITTELCGREISKSTVSGLTKRLDEQVQARDERCLDPEYPFLVLDAMHITDLRHLFPTAADFKEIPYNCTLHSNISCTF
jgi:hypothetical protein